jgi:hypothetical protein
LKWSRNHPAKSTARSLATAGAIGFIVASSLLLSARGELPKWMQFVVAGSDVEAALYRAMDAAGVKVLYPRPPAESRAELSNLVKAAPRKADLYALRAREDEQMLDFSAAESDWKSYAAETGDPTGAKLELADFYARRMRRHDEISTLLEVADASSPVEENGLDPAAQRSWQAFQRIFTAAKDAELSTDEAATVYQAWIRRYPSSPSVYSDDFAFLIDAKRFDDAAKLIEAYKQAFPEDAVFPVKASALLEYRSGSADRALSVYDHAFDPLWPDELIASYMQLLDQTHNERRYLADARQRLMQNPDDLNAAARIYYYYRQQGRADAAQQALTAYRLSKEQRHAVWTATELDTLAQLFNQAQNYPEAARYYYALYSAKETVRGADPQQAALSGIIGILLAAPDQPIQLGAGNLAMYRDIATMDTGPGYFNGILSLFFNSSSPESEAHDEEQRAQSYFHRGKAEELLTVLDAKFPSAPARPGLHAAMVSLYENYGLSDAVIREGSQYLAQFPQGANRFSVAMAVADAYARENRTQKEFGVYDRMLAELSQAAKGMPLSNASAAEPIVQQDQADRSGQEDGNDEGSHAPAPPADLAQSRALQAAPGASPQPHAPPRAGEYSQVLERYLSRLIAARQLPQALTVLRREMDRNPNDPGIYARLAEFLEQNRFDAQQEEIYRRAMNRFPDKGWYDKLARLYLREKKHQEFLALSRQVVDTFQGTDLERYFSEVHENSPQFYLEVNLYANRRFPHDMVFVENLLNAYSTRLTADPIKREALLREHWFESAQLQAEFFDQLSRGGRLQAEMAALQSELSSTAAGPSKNYAAMHELAEADLWFSRFEESAPLLGELASAYPAQQRIGDDAADVFRSLAYFDPQQTGRAVAIEKNLLLAEPGNLERVARIGDIYADRGRMTEASQYWQQMPAAHPGSPDGYLQAATVFWDYFRFDDALNEIQAVRAKFHQPALYGYEAGAIEENKGDGAAAVREYTLASLAGDANSDARNRLLVLAARPATRDAADAATEQAIADPNASPAALDLRVDVLSGQNRATELPALLAQAIAKTESPDVLDHIKQIANAHGLSAQSEAALQREITLASDPVHRMELELELAHEDENRKDPDPADAILQALYRENPRILGVIRASVDFDWRNDHRSRAIATLLQAAKDAAPNLSPQFSLEAADKASQFGQYVQARQTLAPLLADSPFDLQYISAMAETYARANDNAGLRDFYLAKIKTIQSVPMSRDDRKTQIAQLRRNLIPALTRLEDYEGATDQYIAILSAYPEDASLLDEIDSYAIRYHREQQLIAFGNKAVADSPRDSRLAIVLARAERAFQDYPAAIAAYSKAIAIRSDRSDLYEERVGLEERLQRFDDACADYERLYVLSYKDPQWIVDEAKTRVRQGNAVLAVQALKTVWVDGHPERASDQFQIARQLEEWGLIDQARQFAEEGVKLAGNDLLQPQNASGAALYARIETRLRRQEEAYQTLRNAQQSAGTRTIASPSVIVEQVEKQGIASVTDAQWREREIDLRRNAAEINFRSAMLEMGSAVSRYFTPEEKLAFAQFAKKKRVGFSREQLATTWIPLIHEASLLDVEEQWRAELIAEGGSLAAQQIQPFSELEITRLRFNELGNVLEKYAATLPGQLRDQVLTQAADAYLKGGNSTQALAVMESMNVGSHAMDGLRDRYFSLLLARSPDALVRLAGHPSSESADAVVNFLLDHPDEAHVASAIAARTRPAIWKNANIALAGLYYADKSSTVDTAFLEAIGDETIGERIVRPLDSAQRLTGDAWFYYGMRYGVYRTFSGHGDEEDFIAAGLEHDPRNSASYVALADAYADAGEHAKAIAEYKDALQIAPQSAGIYDAMAELQWSDSKHDEAIAEWKTALGLLRAQVALRAVPESFWTSFASIAGHLGEHKIAASLKPEMDAVAREYIAKNGSYQSEGLLSAAFASLNDPQQGIAWVMDLAMVAKAPTDILDEIRDAAWIPLPQKQVILEQEVQFERRPISPQERQNGVTHDSKAEELASAQIRLVDYLVLTRQFAHAAEIFDSIAPPMRATNRGDLLADEIQISAHTGTLANWLAAYQKSLDANGDQAGEQSEPGDELDTLASQAQALFKENDNGSARSLLEFVLHRRQESGTASSPDYLALSEVDIAASDMTGVLEQLRRLLLIGDYYANLDASASLLERTSQNAEALEFLEPLAAGVPWEPNYKLRMAEAQMRASVNLQAAQEAFVQLSSGSLVPYSVRAQAAEALHGANNTVNPGSAELALLASNNPIAAEQADVPYFLPARVAAARTARNPKKLLLDALSCGAGNDARLMLFHAEFALGHNALALSTIEPLLSSTDNSYPVPRWARSRESGDEEPDTGARELPLVPAADRFKVAEELAELYEREKDLSSATAWLDTASALSGEPGRRKELQNRATALRARLALEAGNASRRPVIQESLDQANAVRPRLVSAINPPLGGQR